MTARKKLYQFNSIKGMNFNIGESHPLDKEEFLNRTLCVPRALAR